MHHVPRLTLICCLITLAAAYGQEQQLQGEFYEYEDQISIESRSGALETVVMPENQPNAYTGDQEKIDLIKEKMLKRRSGLAARNNGQPAAANMDDLDVPTNFRAPSLRKAQSRSSTTTTTPSTTTTTASVPEVEADSRPKLRRTRPNGNRLRSTTTSTTTVPTTTTEEVTTTAAAPAADAPSEPEPSATFTERKDEASLEDLINISPLFRESLHRIDTVPEHTRDTAYFREPPIAELPIPKFPRVKDLPTPINETMDGVPIYFMNAEITNGTSDPPLTTLASVNDEIIPVTQETEVEFTTIEDHTDEIIPEDEDDIHGERRSDEVEGSRQLQRKFLDMMVSETKNILTAVIPDRAMLAAFKYFPLFEPQLESRSSNYDPYHEHNAQRRPRPPPRHRPLPKTKPQSNIRPNHVNRRPPPPRPPHGKPENHHGKPHHGHEPQPPANFEPYEPFSINFQPPREPDFRKKPEPNYKPSQPVEYPKYEQPSLPKLPTSQYPSEQSYRPEHLKEPTYKPQTVHKPEYSQVPSDAKPPQYENAHAQQYPKVQEHPSGHTEKPYDKPQVLTYPREPSYEPAYPSAPQQEKPYEKPATPRYPQEPKFKATSPSPSQYEKPNAPSQYPKGSPYETAPIPPQYENPYAKPSASKEPAYEPSYISPPKEEKPFTTPPLLQYPKRPGYETSSSAPQYEKPYEKQTLENPKGPTYQPTYPQPAKNDRPYEKAQGLQYPKEPAYPPVPKPNEPAHAPAYTPVPQYEKPGPQYAKEPTYEAVNSQPAQYNRPVPAVQYPKQPTHDTSAPVRQYTKAPAYSTVAPYVTRQHPKKSHSTRAPQYSQENYYSSPKPPISSSAPYVDPAAPYQKPTSPPVYQISTPDPHQPYRYNQPVKQYRVSSTPAPTTTARPPYHEDYPDQYQQPNYPPAQQYPQEPYLSPQPQQYYPQQYQHTQEEPTRQKGSNTRKTPTRGNQQKQEQTDQRKRPQSNNAPYDDTPFEQIDPVPENEYQEPEQYSVSVTAPPQKGKKPSSNLRNRVTSPKPPSYAQEFPPRIPSNGFEGQQWAAEDITADKFPDFKISSFFQDTPWPQPDSFISQNGGSQRQATQPKRKGENSQRLQQTLAGEHTGKTSLKADEILSSLASEAEEQAERNRNQEPVLNFKDTDYPAVPAELSPVLTGVRDSGDTNKNPPKDAESPSAESAVVATPTATRRKDTHTRPRIQNRRITKPKPELE